MATHAQPSQTDTKRSAGIRIGGLVLVVALVGGLAGWILVTGRLPFGPPNFHGVLIQSPHPVADFTLTAHTGEKMSLSDFRGKVVLIYFGYTFCPDACPATMNELKEMKRELGERADNLQVLMVTVDPDRDTREALGEYLGHFDPTFIGLTGSEEEILTAATPLGIYYSKNEGSPATGYLVDHTTSLVAIDSDGYLRLIYSHGTPGEDIAADMRYLAR